MSSVKQTESKLNTEKNTRSITRILCETLDIIKICVEPHIDTKRQLAVFDADLSSRLVLPIQISMSNVRDSLSLLDLTLKLPDGGDGRRLNAHHVARRIVYGLNPQVSARNAQRAFPSDLETTSNPLGCLFYPFWLVNYHENYDENRSHRNEITKQELNYVKQSAKYWSKEIKLGRIKR